MQTGDIIKKLRESLGMTQEELGKVVGVKKAAVHKWETGQTKNLKRSVIERLSTLFNVSPSFLMGMSAFKNRRDLFEHWGYVDEGFESAFDFGALLKKERIKQGITVNEVSKALNITDSDVEEIEEGLLPLNYQWAEKFAKFLGTNTSQIFFDNDLYWLQVPEEYHDKVRIWEQKIAMIESERSVSAENLKRLKRLDFDGWDNAPPKRSSPKFPSVFTDPKKAREYLAMHQIFGSDGFNNSDIEDMSDDEVIEFANEAMKMLEMVSYKYKK